LGIWGVKLMNILLASGALWLIYRIARRLQLANAWMAPLILASVPLHISLILSGLTEPLFAFVLLLGVWWLLQKKYYAALLLLSFLPFVRSEGLVICCVIFIYLLVKEKYDLIPLLGVGHVVYSMLGYVVHKDLLWVFNKMSYATWGSVYGQGRWMHFINKMPEVAGVIVSLLLWIGMLFGLVLLVRYLRRRLHDDEVNQLWLIYAIFTAFFIAHTAFWALGIFNSMGLLRVMTGITPFIALIALQGISYLQAPVKQWRWSRWIAYVLLAAVLLFPFSKHELAYKWERDFSLKADQLADADLAAYVKQNFPDYKKYDFYYEPCYLSVTLDIDYFDNRKHKRLLGAFEQNNFADSCFIVWDDWFAVQSGNVPYEKLEKDGRFQLIQLFERKDYWNSTRRTALFRKVKP
jgi:hypothetical protein